MKTHRAIKIVSSESHKGSFTVSSIIYIITHSLFLTLAPPLTCQSPLLSLLLAVTRDVTSLKWRHWMRNQLLSLENTWRSTSIKSMGHIIGLCVILSFYFCVSCLPSFGELILLSAITVWISVFTSWWRRCYLLGSALKQTIEELDRLALQWLSIGGDNSAFIGQAQTT